jgi:hypothetical protein
MENPQYQQPQQQPVQQQPQYSNQGIYSYPDQVAAIQKELNTFINMLKESSNTLITLRRTMKGEALMENNNKTYWVQLTKPKFVKMDLKTNKPLKQMVQYEGEEPREIYVPNDEAIEEVLSLLSSMGINNTTKLTDLSEPTILTDLRLFEKKLAAFLCLKQKEWGIDKEELPLLQLSLGTMVQDARYQAKDGAVLVSLQKTIQEIKQVVDQSSNKSKLTMTPFA